MYIHMCSCACVYMYIRVCICIYVNMSLHIVCVYLYVYIYTYGKELRKLHLNPEMNNFWNYSLHEPPFRVGSGEVNITCPVYKAFKGNFTL